MISEKKKASGMYKKLASGGTAEIYDMGDGRLFKDFHDDKPDGSIENEYDCTTKIRKYNLGAPLLYERVNDERGRGFIMEFIKGPDLLTKLSSEGEDLEQLTTLWARLQFRINSVHTKEFPNGRRELLRRLEWLYPEESRLLTGEQLLKLKMRVLALPEDDCLCHTDFQPGNVVITDLGPRIIDWCDTMTDSKWFDVGRTMVFLEKVEFPPQFDQEKVRKLFAYCKEIFCREYFSLAGDGGEELQVMTALWAAVKLPEETGENARVMKNLIERVI